MRRFFEKYLDSMDENDVYNYIRKDFDEDWHKKGDGRWDHHHYDNDYKMKKLAKILSKIQDYFEVSGVDPRAFLEEHYRRNGHNR